MTQITTPLSHTPRPRGPLALLRAVTGALMLALTALPAAAACTGADLLDALPAAERAALERAAHAVPHAQGLLFRAEKSGQRVTVVGTYHLHDDRHAGLVAAVSPALDDATALLVEAGPDEERALQAAMARDPALGFIMAGPTLPERLSEADWQRLRSAAEARGVPGPVAAKMQPWLVTVTLALSPCEIREAQLGAQGLDQLLMDQAAARGVPVAALEPYDTAFRIFEGLSAQEESDMIVVALSAVDRADDYAQTLADAYFDAEPRLIWEFGRHDALANAGLPAAAIEAQMALAEDRLMVSRNRAWIAPIETAAAKGPVVVAVGALHLSGEAGVLALLESRGWTVTRLDG